MATCVTKRACQTPQEQVGSLRHHIAANGCVSGGTNAAPLALATGVWQESHLIGLRMVCDFLQHDNWRVEWYPSNDRATVRDWTRRLRPAVVLLSVGLDRGVEPARRLVYELRHRAGHDGLIVVGGAAINRDPDALVATVGADLTATNGLELVRRLRARTRAEVGE